MKLSTLIFLSVALTARAGLDDDSLPASPNIIALGAAGQGPESTATHYAFYVREISETNWTHHALIPVTHDNYAVWCSFLPKWDATNVFMVRATNTTTGAQSRQSMSLTNITPKMSETKYTLDTPRSLYRIP